MREGEKMKISDIHVFTNRNTLFFDESGDSMPDLQALFSWRQLREYGSEIEKRDGVLKQIINDAPNCYIARWGQSQSDTWVKEIRVEEFFCLFGLGQQYQDLTRGGGDDER